MQDHAAIRVDHAAYAGTLEQSPYDLMAAHNREYRLILEQVEQMFRRHAQKSTRIADLGCGTGNFTKCIAEGLADEPRREIEAVDITPAMLDIAKRKSQTWRTHHRFSFREGDIRARELFEGDSFDAINTVHALNLTKEPQAVISNIAHWLKPGGFFCAVDIGRPLVLRNWAKGLMKWVFLDCRKLGAPLHRAAIETARFLIQARQAAKQNRNFESEQREGLYPMHTPEQYARWFTQAGLQIAEARQMYADPATGTPISDLVVGFKSEQK